MQDATGIALIFTCIHQQFIFNMLHSIFGHNSNITYQLNHGEREREMWRQGLLYRGGANPVNHLTIIYVTVKAAAYLTLPGFFHSCFTSFIFSKLIVPGGTLKLKLSPPIIIGMSQICRAVTQKMHAFLKSCAKTKGHFFLEALDCSCLTRESQVTAKILQMTD